MKNKLREKEQKYNFKKWQLKIQDNLKDIYNYDADSIEFLKKYDIAERKFM